MHYALDSINNNIACCYIVMYVCFLTSGRKREYGSIGKISTTTAGKNYKPYDVATITLNLPDPGDSWPSPQLTTSVVLEGAVKVDSTTTKTQAFFVGAKSSVKVGNTVILHVTWSSI